MMISQDNLNQGNITTQELPQELNIPQELPLELNSESSEDVSSESDSTTTSEEEESNSTSHEITSKTNLSKKSSISIKIYDILQSNYDFANSKKVKYVNSLKSQQTDHQTQNYNNYYNSYNHYDQMRLNSKYNSMELSRNQRASCNSNANVPRYLRNLRRPQGGSFIEESINVNVADCDSPVIEVENTEPPDAPKMVKSPQISQTSSISSNSKISIKKIKQKIFKKYSSSVSSSSNSFSSSSDTEWFWERCLSHRNRK